MQIFLKHNKTNIDENFEYIIDDVQLKYLTLRDENTKFTMDLKLKFI